MSDRIKMDYIEVEKEGSVTRIWINRPEKRNALNSDVVSELLAALEESRDDASRVIVLGGRGKVFSAGADLKSLQALQDASAEENLADSEHLANLFTTIYRYPKPVIARVHGHAIAGGCGLAAVCDFSYVAEGSKLGFTEVRIGFVPAIVSVFLIRKLGEASLRDLLLRGDLITASEGEAMGLVTEALPGEKIDDRITEVASELARETSATAVAQTKSLLAALPGMGLSEAVASAVQANALARSTDDCQAGISAFLSRDDPPWKKFAETAKKKTDSST